MFLEWTDPPFAPGHWIPEMIELAGGEPAAGHGGENSRRVTWDDVHAPGPTSSSSRRAATTATAARRSPTTWWPSGALPAGVPVHAVDANASWARPAPGSSTVSRSWPGPAPADEVLTGDGLRYVGDNGPVMTQ